MRRVNVWRRAAPSHVRAISPHERLRLRGLLRCGYLAHYQCDRTASDTEGVGRWAQRAAITTFATTTGAASDVPHGAMRLGVRVPRGGAGLRRASRRRRLVRLLRVLQRTEPTAGTTGAT